MSDQFSQLNEPGRHYIARPAPPQQGAGSLSPRDILSVLFKHKWKILVIALLGLAGGPIVYKLTPRVYEANAQLMVKFGWEYMYSPELAMQGNSASPYARNEVLNSEVQILNSQDLKERVITKLGVAKIYPRLAEQVPELDKAKELAVLAMEQSLQVRTIKNSSIVELAFQGPDPQTAAEVVYQLIYYYGAKRIEIFKDPKSILFLEKKAAEYQQKLRETEDEMAAFKQKNEVFALGEQLTMLLQRRSELAGSLLSNANLTKELQEKLATYEKELKAIPQTVASGELAPAQPNNLQTQLVTLQMKEQELLGKYKEDSRSVADVRRQMEVLRKNMASAAGSPAPAGPKTENTVHQEIQKEIVKCKAELSSLRANEKLVQGQIAKLDEEIKLLDSREKRLRELQRDLASDEHNYVQARKKLEEVRVFDEMDRQKMTSVSVLQPATVPLKPIKPSKPPVIYIALGLALGLGGGCGLAFALEMLSSAMRTPEDVEKHLQLPVLVSIPDKKATLGG